MSPRHNQFFIVVALLFVIIFRACIGSTTEENSGENTPEEINTSSYSPELLDKIKNFHAVLDKHIRDKKNHIRDKKNSSWLAWISSVFCLFKQDDDFDFEIKLRRGNILEDSFQKITKASFNQLMAQTFMVHFKGEENFALTSAPKEWLTQLSDEIFHPKSKYFKYTDTDIYTIQIRPMQDVKPRDEKFYYFVGRVMGIVIYRGYRIHRYLSKVIYSKILGKEIELKDIEDVDRIFYRSLSYTIENVQSSSDLDFEVEGRDEHGNNFVHNLNPSREPLMVTDYVRLYIQWKFAPKKQTNAFLRGLHELIPLDLLRASFDEKELELLVCGIHELNVKEWRANTIVIYHISPHSSSEFLKWFWEVVEEFDDEKRAKLLEYVTGSRSLPVGGFKALDGYFKIELLYPVDESTDKVIPPPQAHTCSSTISLPIYKSRETLKQQLEMIVEEPLKYNAF